MNLFCKGKWTACREHEGWWVCDCCGRRLWPVGKAYEVKT